MTATPPYQPTLIGFDAAQPGSDITVVTICDPFMSTGSTGVAAIRAGKRFVGIEHNPKHFETALTRIRAAIEETA